MNPKRLGHAAGHADCWVSCARPFERRNISAVDTGIVCKLFLRFFLRSPQPPHVRRKAFAEFLIRRFDLGWVHPPLRPLGRAHFHSQ